jgi:hypothetical protein
MRAETQPEPTFFWLFRQSAWQKGPDPPSRKGTKGQRHKGEKGNVIAPQNERKKEARKKCWQTGSPADPFLHLRGLAFIRGSLFQSWEL